MLFAPLLLNGDFSEARDPAIAGIPWWRVPRGALAPELRERPGGVGVELVTKSSERGDARLEQPVPAYGPTSSGLRLRGHVRGKGVLTLSDSHRSQAWPMGRTWMHRFDSPEGTDFDLAGAELFTGDEAAQPEPRLLVSLACDGPGEAAWSNLELLVPLPAPTAAELRSQILDLLTELFGTLLERSLDDVGPRESALWCRVFDAETGAPFPASTAVHGDPLYPELFAAWRVEPVPAWEAALVRYQRDWMELCLHPDTGLPRNWDPVADVPRDGDFVEIHWSLRQLIDWAEAGPEEQRDAALRAAVRIGEAVLERGVFPDDTVASKYRPKDGAPSMAVPEIRYLDVPAQLARLGAVTGDERYLRAARMAVLAVEYTHHWPGDWRGIDPGFDDTFGHIGKRSEVMWKAVPSDPVLGRLARTGYETYAPLWKNALRYGGNVAADQVRCWEVFGELARLEPEWREPVRQLLTAAVHSHLRGEQGAGGAWSDVTIAGFDPKPNLGVGDLPGIPVNLIEGLAFAYDAELGMDLELVRSAYTAVLRSSVQTYGHPFGFRNGRRPPAVAGTPNPASGSLRLLAGLVEMLERLER